MSTTSTARLEPEPVEDLTPVAVPAEALDSTSTGHLRRLQRELADAGQVPAVLRTTCCFDEDCSLATAEEADRLREHVRAAAFLGATRLEVRVETVACRDAAETALAACAERARREGVRLDVRGPIDLPDATGRVDGDAASSDEHA